MSPRASGCGAQSFKHVSDAVGMRGAYLERAAACAACAEPS